MNANIRDEEVEAVTWLFRSKYQSSNENNTEAIGWDWHYSSKYLNRIVLFDYREWNA